MNLSEPFWWNCCERMQVRHM